MTLRILPRLLLDKSSGRNFSTSVVNFTIKNVTVIGGGTMGAGIAQVAAQAGNNVNLVDVNTQLLEKSKDTIQKSIARVAKKLYKDSPSDGEKFITSSLANINYLTDQIQAVESAELIVEAIIENLEIKQKLFAQLDKIAPKHTIFASNTSSLQISEIAQLTSRKDKFGGLHFFSPVPVMRLLEVVSTKDTSTETHQKLTEWSKSIGKVPVKCKDTPGFIVNRLLVPYKMEAMRMVERGDATPEDIDLAMKLGAGYPMGPFELTDNVGVDIGYFIMQGWEKKFPNDPNFKVPKILENLVKEGKLGKKTGIGFYNYKK